jgi:hypothetical protein
MTVTYEKIATTILGSAQATVTFSSITGTYTDLVLISNAKATAGENGFAGTLNGDGGSSYSTTYLYGTGSTASSVRASGSSMNIARTDSTAFWAGITSFMNYSNTTTYKTVLTRGNSGSIVTVNVGLWRSTAAITSITLGCATGDFVTGSTFTLYGIKAE